MRAAAIRALSEKSVSTRGREHYMHFLMASWNLNNFSHEVQGVARQLEPQLQRLAPCLVVLRTHKHDTCLAHGRQVLIATMGRLR